MSMDTPERPLHDYVGAFENQAFQMHLDISKAEQKKRLRERKSDPLHG